MTEIKIGVNDFGTLFAILPDGSVRTILIDVHDTQHYGISRIGEPTAMIFNSAEEEKEGGE